LRFLAISLAAACSQRNESAPRADFPRNPVPDFLQYICEWLEMSSHGEKSKKAKTRKKI
jgi:hypothetical protein